MLFLLLKMSYYLFRRQWPYLLYVLTKSVEFLEGMSNKTSTEYNSDKGGVKLWVIL